MVLILQVVSKPSLIGPARASNIIVSFLTFQTIIVVCIRISKRNNLQTHVYTRIDMCGL